MKSPRDLVIRENVSIRVAQIAAVEAEGQCT